MYNKQYASDSEMVHRFQIFKQSLKRIEARTKTFPNGATYGINKFSDLTPEEFKSTYLMKNKITPVLQHKEASDIIANNIPASIDWRDHGVVTPVKDQGDCGSCWAFSATETIESAWIKAGKSTADKLALAPQQLVDCDHFALGCNGGIPGGAFHNIMVNGGQEAESSYPYQAEVGWCRFNKSLAVAKVKGWKYATEVADEVDLQTSLATVGPVSICLDAMNWQDYTSGVMTASECAWINLLDHCVQLVGYNTSAPTPYWIVRNSWNTDWGIDGYIHLEMGHDTCGITYYSTYVEV
jgi:cathepsin F